MREDERAKDILPLIGLGRHRGARLAETMAPVGCRLVRGNYKQPPRSSQISDVPTNIFAASGIFLVNFFDKWSHWSYSKCKIGDGASIAGNGHIFNIGDGSNRALIEHILNGN